ncbi:MAG: hypothetical protein ABI894_02085, partial [Ilumatobacteraceae bacterium]
MTVLATRAETRRAPSRSLATLAAGFFGGLAFGIVARLWMRFIAEDPDFTWNGTIFILGGFTVFGFTQSAAAEIRRRAKHRWPVVVGRTIGLIGLLPIFVGAGAVMLPTVVGGGLARARVDWHRAVRMVWLLVAVAPVMFVASQLVGSFGWSLHAAVGFLAMLAIYGTIIAVTKQTFAGQARREVERVTPARHPLRGES